MHTVRGDGVAGIKRRRRDIYGDGIRNLAMASGHGRLKEDLESSTWRRRQNLKDALEQGIQIMEVDVKPKIIISRDVVFNESLMFKDTLKGAGVVDSRKEVEFEIKEGIEGVQKTRVIISLTACEDYELEQHDVKTAFLHGNLEETIYMASHLVLKKEQATIYDSCVYFKEIAPSMYIYLLMYVDDMLIACKSKSEIEYTKGLLRKEFDIKELGPARKILGMKIVRDRVGLCVIGSTLQGSLMYLMVYPRPDITYAVSIVSRYLANPGKNHWEVVKWILKYSKGTADVGLVYGRDQGKHIVVDGFVNADYAKDPDKDRSITGRAYGTWLSCELESNSATCCCSIYYKCGVYDAYRSC
ncbi:retrovirus-related pol polyprotein from transposon TNT 1-94 [Tanacetum coccineum]